MAFLAYFNTLKKLHSYEDVLQVWLVTTLSVILKLYNL